MSGSTSKSETGIRSIEAITAFANSEDLFITPHRNHPVNIAPPKKQKSRTAERTSGDDGDISNRKAR